MHINIGGRKLGKGEPCYIVAELSANHNQDYDIAVETIKAAKDAGADAIKLQTYTADTLTLDIQKPPFVIDNGSIWDGRTYYELYKEAYTPWEWHSGLKSEAEKAGLDFFSSPFDNTAVDFLDALDVDVYKIASFEIVDTPLIEYTASKGKPVIISTGIAEYDDIKLAVETCRKVGNNDIVLLKCTSSYPAPVEDANLSLMPKFYDDFGCLYGLSDHTMGDIVPCASVALGACLIEKHFILDRNQGGPDASFSMTPPEFSEMVKRVRETEKTVGTADYVLTDKQKSGRDFSRSLYACADIKAGEIATDKNIGSFRPNAGLHPKYYKELLGKKLKRDVPKGTPLDFDMFE